MTRLILVTIAALAFATPGFADVTLKSTSTGKGIGMSGTMVSTTYIKGNKMRTDTVMGDTTRTIIFDVDAQRLYSFDSKKKEADVWDMTAFGNNIQAAVDVSAMKASIKPNGKTPISSGTSALTPSRKCLLRSVIRSFSRGAPGVEAPGMNNSIAESLGLLSYESRFLPVHSNSSTTSS